MRLTREQAHEFARQRGLDPSALGLADETDTSSPQVRPKPRRESGPSPQAQLTVLARQRWGDEIRTDYVGAVPGRRFEIDITLPAYRIAIEVDGWAFHGKHKRDFHRDREKRNALVLNGWLVLAFSARDVMADPLRLLDMVEQLIDRRRRAWRT